LKVRAVPEWAGDPKHADQREREIEREIEKERERERKRET
jgi:hypothetical protein